MALRVYLTKMPDCILLGIELGTVDGDIFGSDDVLSLVPSLGLLLGT